ncbi:radial spokehead-like protein [Blastocladiella britannica]|nr:radial spokehead-like protein [Blastocladiella britannica]
MNGAGSPDDIAASAQMRDAKQYLQMHSDRTGFNVYDHLTDLVASLLDKRPKNPADAFEGVSSQIKRQRFALDALHAPLGFKKVHDLTPAHTEVHKLAALLQSAAKTIEENATGGGADDGAGQVPDILDLAALFETAGISLGKQETLLLTLSVHALVKDQGLTSARFWGKVTATHGAYYIVEAEGCPPEETDGEEGAAGSGSEGSGGTGKVIAGEEGEDPIAMTIEMPEFEGFPQPKKPVPKALPKEEGTGCNKYTYFVCPSLGDAWTRLPDISPSHISTARTVRKQLVGDLKRNITAHPQFIGTEAHYLRAQIARITAATVVCPAGYYTFDPEAQDDEHPELNTALILNAEYEVLPNEAMQHLDNWVHQMPYVLPQGRTVWVNPIPPKEEGGEENGAGGQGEDGEDGGDGAGDGEDDESGDATGGGTDHDVEPEAGPALLTPVTEDTSLAPSVPAWSVRPTSRLMPAKFSATHLRSNRWPGAHAVYYNGKFACMYVGDGLKELGGVPLAMPAIPPLATEYKLRANAPAEYLAAGRLVEQNDPTVEDEKRHEEMLKEREDDAQPDEGDAEPANE